MAIFDPAVFDGHIFDTGTQGTIFDAAIFDSCIFDTGEPCPSPTAQGGAGKFSNLSRGMLVIDAETWEEEGVILPLTLDTFP
jgi:hypothetical protein